MSFSGDLQGLSLADVFQNVAGNRSTGWMTVEWRQRSCYVRFHDGVVTGFSFGEGEHLVGPEFLRQRGYLDDDSLERLRGKLRRSKKTVCQIALATRLIEPEVALDAIVTRVEEQIFDLMLLREATFEFVEGESPPGLFDCDQDPSQIGLEVGPLLMEGARRRDEWQQIRRLVGTDRDLVVLLEGWDEAELDPLEQTLVEFLDGRTDVRAIVQEVTASRFDVMRSLANLVQRGVARLATAEEIEIAADESAADGDLDGAVQLLEQASKVERSNPDIKQKLIDLLVQLDRHKDAAADLASIAHQTAADGELKEAADLYARAFELNPDDVPLLEHRVEILKSTGDDDLYVEGLEQLVDVYLNIGVADRARSALRLALERRSLRHDERVVHRLAVVESSLGHWEESSRLFRELGEHCLTVDEPRSLELFRSALEQTPDDQALANRIRDIENGQARRRRLIRSRATQVAAGLAVLVALGFGAIVEFRATHRVIDAFSGSLTMHDGGDSVEALVELDAVRRDYVWTPARSRAVDLFDRLADTQLQIVEDWLRSGEYGRARDLLTRLVERIDRADLRSTCEALLERVEAESAALLLLRQADRDGDVDPADLASLSQLADPKYLEFHLAQVEGVAHAEARFALLRALVSIESPRAVPVFARLFLTEQHEASVDLIEQAIKRAGELPHSARADWKGLREYLESAALVDETADSARRVLDLLYR